MATTTTENTAAGTETHTEVAGGAHGESKFPPLDTTTFPSQLFWLILTFGALYALMSRFALPRMGKILGDRKARLDGDLARAQALKEETENAIKAYEKSLADARGKAQDIARDTRAAMTKDIDAAQAKVNASLAQKIADAEQRIAKSKEKALASVNAIASESAKDIVAALTGGVKAKG